MNKTILAIVASSSLAATTASMAAPEHAKSAPQWSSPNSDSTSLYVNGGVGYSHRDIDTGMLNGVILDKDSFAWSANLGYNFSPHAAIELGYVDLPYSKLSVKDINGNLKAKLNAVTLDVKGIHYISNKFNAFVKAGLAYESASPTQTIERIKIILHSNEHHVSPLFGLGAAYKFNDNVAVTVQGVNTLRSGHFPATYTGFVGLTYKLK